MTFRWRQADNLYCPVGDVAGLFEGISDPKVATQNVAVIVFEPFDIQFTVALVSIQR